LHATGELVGTSAQLELSSSGNTQQAGKQQECMTDAWTASRHWGNEAQLAMEHGSN